MSWSINCIGYGEPLFWVSLAASALLGSAFGSWLVTMLRRRPTDRATLVVLPTLAAITLSLVLSFAVLATLYAIVRGGIVCVHFVRSGFLAPVLVTAALTVRAGIRKPTVEAQA